MGFQTLFLLYITFFSILSLDIKFFANFSVEKTIRTPCNRAKFPASGVWDQPKCLFNAPFCGDKLFTEKRQEYAFCIYYFYEDNSHHDKQHKVSTALTLLHRAVTLPNTNEGKQLERKHNKHVDEKWLSQEIPTTSRTYSKSIIQQNRTPSPEELVRLLFESMETKTNCNYAVLPYIEGLIEPLKRNLKPYDILACEQAPGRRGERRACTELYVNNWILNFIHFNIIIILSNKIKLEMKTKSNSKASQQKPVS